MTIKFKTDLDYLTRRGRLRIDSQHWIILMAKIVFACGVFIDFSILIAELFICNIIDLTIIIYLIILFIVGVIFFVLDFYQKKKLRSLIMRKYCFIHHCELSALEQAELCITFNKDTYEINYMGKTQIKKYANILKLIITDEFVICNGFYIEKKLISESEFNHVVDILECNISKMKICRKSHN